MKKAIIVMIASVMSFQVLWAAERANVDKTVLATVGKEKITYGDLEKAYKRNLNRKNSHLYETTKDSLMDFLNLYINFRLKVNDAISRGFENDSAVKADFESNRKLLAESFFYDKVLTDPEVNKEAERRKNEYKIAIILTSHPQTPASDTVEAWKKINEALGALKNGMKFADVAAKYSEDENSASKGGEIGNYITSGKVQRPLEDAIYNTKEGSYNPKIVVLKYGYVIVKVLKIVPRVKVMASHILFSWNQGLDSANIVAKADSVLKLLRSGEDFATLAEKFSKDPATAEKGGSIGHPYSRSTGLDPNGQPLVPEFEQTIWDLKDGQISGLVKSDFGIHIIKRDSTIPINLEEEKDDIRKSYKRLYYLQDRLDWLDSVAATSYGYELNKTNLAEMMKHLDTNRTNIIKTWADSIPEDVMKLNLFKFDKKNYTVGDFVGIMKSMNDLRNISLNYNGIQGAIRTYYEPIIFKDKTKNLEKEYPEFNQMMSEFHDGILLFRVEAMEVWDKLKFDTAQAEKYYDTLSKTYMTDPSYDLSEIYVLTDSAAQNIYSQLKSGADFEKLASEETQRSGFREKKGQWGIVSIDKNQLAKEVKEKSPKDGEILPPFKFERGYSVVKVNKYIPARKKTFHEAIQDIAPGFQDMMQKSLTKNWLDKVREKFPVKVDTAAVDRLISETKGSK